MIFAIAILLSIIDMLNFLLRLLLFIRTKCLFNGQLRLLYNAKLIIIIVILQKHEKYLFLFLNANVEIFLKDSFSSCSFEFCNMQSQVKLFHRKCQEYIFQLPKLTREGLIILLGFYWFQLKLRPAMLI